MAEIERCSLSGDASPATDLIRDAAARQRSGAIQRLRERFPGWDPESSTLNLGLATPTLASTSLDDGVLDGVSSAIDRYLATGDLGERRATLVSSRENRAHPIPPSIGTERSTPNAGLNVDPFLGAEELLAGNTLNLNDAQAHLGGRVQDLCDDLALAFVAHVQMNVYVSWGEAPGFGAHWDDHDVIVVPVAGAKYWTVDEPPALAPIKDVIPAGGTGKSVWSGVLSRGDALMIPRGWPHHVAGLGEEVSVHLTASIRRPTALDLLVHLPSERFEREFELDDADLEHCLGSWASILTTEPRVGPIAATTARLAGFAGHRMRAVMPGGAVFLDERADAEALEMATNNRTVRIPRSSAPALAELLDGWRTVEEISAATGSPRDDVVDLVERLGSVGIVQLESPA
ncbi:cupin domain-containing protein [Dermatobacter hominis]|uniref:cupin domain-containing protein n=1 Tax=Dermatobacter hominis TaxID=2884263 RepID=UPI001D1274F1|nr:cupin domain-containing protein [Dermatobacter hominis]UDY33963.1 cupin domain-containing protein [Dermatobacter hominis]